MKMGAGIFCIRNSCCNYVHSPFNIDRVVNGTFHLAESRHSWTKFAHMVYVEQPVRLNKASSFVAPVLSGGVCRTGFSQACSGAEDTSSEAKV